MEKAKLKQSAEGSVPKNTDTGDTDKQNSGAPSGLKWSNSKQSDRF